jgi:hypothetical protein
LARLADRFSFRVFPTFFVLAFWLSLLAMIRCPFFTPRRSAVAVGNRCLQLIPSGPCAGRFRAKDGWRARDGAVRGEEDGEREIGRGSPYALQPSLAPNGGAAIAAA